MGEGREIKRLAARLIGSFGLVLIGAVSWGVSIFFRWL